MHGTQPQRKSGFLLVLASLGWSLLGQSLAPTAQAQVQITVRRGQTLAAIANKYSKRHGHQVHRCSIAALNAIDPKRPLREGQALAIPERGTIHVCPNQTLSRLARKHRLPLGELRAANPQLKNPNFLGLGVPLRLPGYRPGKAADKTGRWRKRVKGHRPGRVDLIRVRTQGRKKVQLTNRRGRVQPDAARALSRFMRYGRTRKTRRPPRRLVSLLARISDHFGGKPLRIYSGYRPASHRYTSNESRHTRGHAIDFNVKGVPRKVLRDFLLTFPRVGVGYYPNSHFVHLDIRKRKAYWIDLSRPGKRPKYVKPGTYRKQTSRKGAATEKAPVIPTAEIASMDSPAEPAAAEAGASGGPRPADTGPERPARGPHQGD